MTRYLEEVRRSPWRRDGKIKVRTMVGGNPKNRKAVLGKENPRIMRGQTVPGLREELADRT
jgi:hypothetical protein